MNYDYYLLWEWSLGAKDFDLGAFDNGENKIMFVEDVRITISLLSSCYSTY